MTPQIPLGPDNLICPLHRKAMVKVCHTCPLWTHLRGRNANTGQDVDQWGCALAQLPVLMIEVAKEARQGAAATESFRNEMVRQARISRDPPLTAADFYRQIQHD